ncbi:MAG: hypothetical protein EA416_05450 [Trueperaceae bacterium]|nr:MAG: hypothetical protein EA416_05450 [Trueperaceae bacterium]
MTDEAVRITDGCTPLHDHHGAPLGPPFPARLATFDGHVQRLERGWRWHGRLASDDVAELLGSAVRGRSQHLLGPAGAGVSVWLADVWFDAESGGVSCDLVGRSGEALGVLPVDAVLRGRAG